MLRGVSLFSGAGIGDVGFRAGGISFLAHCELEPDRSALCEQNFPEAEMFTGDIWEKADAIINRFKEQGGDALFVVTITAPCQGMSKSGRGKLLREVREGRRPAMDPRNRLILPGLRVAAALRPRFVVFENVPEMRDTLIEDDDGNVRPILEIIERKLGSEYSGAAYDIEVADYGVPQRRARLIIVFTRDSVALKNFEQGAELIPAATHAKDPSKNCRGWVSVAEALAGFPQLDAKDEAAATSDLAFHRVSVLDERKYFWVSNTPEGGGAFDNQCVNPKCLYQGNEGHGNRRGADGINQARKDTPIHCANCGELLPRPTTIEKDGTLRLMSGYTSAYKRMPPNLPAPTLTRNFGFACSDNKLHPYENRVLSIAEAFRLHTLDRYAYSWGNASDTLIRLVIGESIPPLMTELIARHLVTLSTVGVKPKRKASIEPYATT